MCLGCCQSGLDNATEFIFRPSMLVVYSPFPDQFILPVVSLYEMIIISDWLDDPCCNCYI